MSCDFTEHSNISTWVPATNQRDHSAAKPDYATVKNTLFKAAWYKMPQGIRLAFGRWIMNRSDKVRVVGVFISISFFFILMKCHFRNRLLRGEGKSGYNILSGLPWARQASSYLEFAMPRKQLTPQSRCSLITLNDTPLSPANSLLSLYKSVFRNAQ